ncbi:MAG: 3-isopropylmalate dehydratase small subunit [Planctomycetota bacterium]
MTLAAIKNVTGRGVPVPGDDIDTDRIIPARFMRCVTFDGLGEFAFYDVRIDPDTKQSLNHPLDRPEFKGATILVTGNNFGCGSSREHAPQALQKFGIRAIVAGSFAEIFFGNSTTLGIPCVCLPDAAREELMAAVVGDPRLSVTIDLQNRRVSAGTGTGLGAGALSFPFTMPEGARENLLTGRFDSLNELREAPEKVQATAAAVPYAKW